MSRRFLLGTLSYTTRMITTTGYSRFFLKSIALVFSTIFSIAAFAENAIITGKVVSVIDGNTIEVQTKEKETFKILFHGIDCPEIDQDYGDKAKRFLEKLILEKNVSVQLQGKDRWGNQLAIVLVDGELDPRFELLEQGLAWTAERNPMVELESIREKAKEKGKGLWKDDSPTPPWTYRRQQTMLQPKSS